MAVAVITGAVTAGAATIRYPLKQPYRLSGINICLHFTITLLNLKFPYFPCPIAKFSGHTVIRVYSLPGMETLRSIQHLSKLTGWNLKLYLSFQLDNHFNKISPETTFALCFSPTRNIICGSKRDDRRQRQRNLLISTISGGPLSYQQVGASGERQRLS